MNKLWDDTIVAIATPPGIGAIGVIRLSGDQSFSIANKIFPSKDLQQQASHSIHVGILKEDDRVLDEVVISIFKNPRSYTGEDIIEISCHGSPYIQQEVVNACIRAGARLAKPGEFTQRAFLNGKLDLAQAEAVGDLIAANTAASQKAALHTMRGGFAENLRSLRERLLTFSALIELELDFSQEDVEFADRKKFHDLIDELTVSTQQLLSSFSLGNVIKNGVSVAIIGKPNAGKSTLLNALLNENRAIVSEIAGTTRDTIEEVLNIDGILFRLIDTAGIRQHAGDVIEAAGIERSREKMAKADLVLYIFDVNGGGGVESGERKMENRKGKVESGELREESGKGKVESGELNDVKAFKDEFEKLGVKYLLVGNKVDLGEEQQARSKYAEFSNTVFIAARTGLHIEVLKEKMVDAVLQGDLQTENTIITNARHYHALQEMWSALADIKLGLNNNIPGDLLALDIRRCLHFLGAITGEITNEDQLDYIFSKFCIGK